MENEKSLMEGEKVATTLRLPTELLKATKIQAIRAGRSFGAHVAMILMEAVTKGDTAE